MVPIRRQSHFGLVNTGRLIHLHLRITIHLLGDIVERVLREPAFAPPQSTGEKEGG